MQCYLYLVTCVSLCFFQHILTELQLINISKRLVDAVMVRELAANLGIADYEVESALYDHKFINEAGLKVLQIFRERVGSAEAAHQKLGEALVASEMGPVAAHVLGFSCGEDNNNQTTPTKL